ncbi:MAG: alpha/beta fold hydrolase [Pseudomonadota bacterium]|nr:alpha/beta fold hydrolase [Pseudomonadota bacterium]
MIDAHETFSGTWPYKPNFCETTGFKQHYVDEGPKNGEIILCLHGQPTWGYIYRKFIKSLSTHYRVIVPDHMGFGKSETPQDRDYTLRTHVENLGSLIEHLDITDITFVGQDWGGPIAGSYTLKNTLKVKRLCLINTVLGYSGEKAPITPWFQWVAKHEEAGTLSGILGELGSTVLSVMKIIGFQNTSVVTDEWIRAYSAAFPTRDSCIGGIQFPLDIHYKRIVPYVIESIKTGDIKSLLKKPAMLAYGLEDKAIDPNYAINDFKELFPDGPVTELPGIGHFCQEDAPDQIIQLIENFMHETA